MNQEEEKVIQYAPGEKLDRERDVFIGNKNVLYNAECLFMEFHDLLAIPYYTYLWLIRENEFMNQFFHVDTIRLFDPLALYEWYQMRPYQNILRCLEVREGFSNDPDELDEILARVLNEQPDLYDINTNLIFSNSFFIAMKAKGLVKRFVIYSRHEEEGIKRYIQKWCQNISVDYVHGKFEDVVEEIPKDTTYAFSDIEKVNTLVEKGRIDYSAVIIGDGLRYNRLSNDITKQKVDLVELMQKHICKIGLFEVFKDSMDVDEDYLPHAVQTIMRLDAIGQIQNLLSENE